MLSSKGSKKYPKKYDMSTFKILLISNIIYGMIVYCSIEARVISQSVDTVNVTTSNPSSNANSSRSLSSEESLGDKFHNFAEVARNNSKRLVRFQEPSENDQKTIHPQGPTTIITRNSSPSQHYPNTNNNQPQFDVVSEGSGGGSPRVHKAKLDDTEDTEDDDDDYEGEEFDYRDNLDIGSGRRMQSNLNKFNQTSPNKPSLSVLPSNSTSIVNQQLNDKNQYYSPFRPPQQQSTQAPTTVSVQTSNRVVSTIPTSIPVTTIHERPSQPMTTTTTTIPIESPPIPLMKPNDNQFRHQPEPNITLSPMLHTEFKTDKPSPNIGHNIAKNLSANEYTYNYEDDDENNDDDTDDSINFEDDDATDDNKSSFNKTGLNGSKVKLTPSMPEYQTTTKPFINSSIRVTTITPVVTSTIIPDKLNVLQSNQHLNILENNTQTKNFSHIPSSGNSEFTTISNLNIYTSTTKAPSRSTSKSHRVDSDDSDDYDDDDEDEEQETEDGDHHEDDDDDKITVPISKPSKEIKTSTPSPNYSKIDSSSTTTSSTHIRPNYNKDPPKPFVPPQMTTTTTTNPTTTSTTSTTTTTTTTTQRPTTIHYRLPVPSTTIPPILSSSSVRSPPQNNIDNIISTYSTTQKPIPYYSSTTARSIQLSTTIITTQRPNLYPSWYTTTVTSVRYPTTTRNQVQYKNDQTLLNPDVPIQDVDSGITKQIYDKAVEVYRVTNQALEAAIEAVSAFELKSMNVSFEPLLADSLLFMFGLGLCVITFVLTMLLLVYIIDKNIQPAESDDSSIY